jgi:hypothetical protein
LEAETQPFGNTPMVNYRQLRLLTATWFLRH